MFAASIQGGGVLAKKQVSKRPRYNVSLIPHRRAYLWVWVLCAGPHFPLAFPSGGLAHATQNGLPQVSFVHGPQRWRQSWFYSALVIWNFGKVLQVKCFVQLIICHNFLTKLHCKETSATKTKQNKNPPTTDKTLQFCISTLFPTNHLHMFGLQSWGCLCQVIGSCS